MIATQFQFAATPLVESMFAFEIPPLEKVIRTVIIYAVIVAILRIGGKRLMTQMTSLDLVVVLLISNVVQNAIIGEDNSVTGGVLGAVVLVAMNNGLDRLAQRFEWVRHLVEGRGTTLIRDGEMDDDAIARLGFTRHEVRNALVLQGADETGDVAKATVEPGGNVVVELTDEARPVTAGELRAAVAEIKALLTARG